MIYCPVHKIAENSMLDLSPIYNRFGSIKACKCHKCRITYIDVCGLKTGSLGRTAKGYEVINLHKYYLFPKVFHVLDESQLNMLSKNITLISINEFVQNKKIFNLHSKLDPICNEYYITKTTYTLERELFAKLNIEIIDERKNDRFPYEPIYVKFPKKVFVLNENDLADNKEKLDMKPKEFVESTWLDYSDVTSDCVLMDLNAYIKFQFLKHITKEAMAEKLYDHFMMVELMNKCDFNKLIKSYFKCLNEILESQIETSKQKTRAQKYYEKAVSISKYKKLKFQDLMDYTRIMMCLYMAVTKSHSKLISDFDLSKECLDLDTILTFIRRETVPALGINKRKPRFDFHNPYSMDSCILLILTLVLYKLKDGE